MKQTPSQNVNSFSANYKPPQQNTISSPTSQNNTSSGASSQQIGSNNKQLSSPVNAPLVQQSPHTISTSNIPATSGSFSSQTGSGASGNSSNNNGSVDKSIVKVGNTYTNVFTQSSNSVAGQTQSYSNVVWSNKGSDLTGASSVTGGGLVANYCCAGAFSTTWASKGVTHGKHYWELILSVRPGEQHADAWTASGVAAVQEGKGDSYSVARAVTGSANTLAVSAGRDKSIVNGDTLMFALDADQRIVYWGVNGQWRNGEPGSHGGTNLVLTQNAVFKPFASLSASSNKNTPEGDRWIANFGGKPFRYPIPPEYDSYGAR